VFLKCVEIEKEGKMWPVYAPSNQESVEEMRKDVGKTVSVSKKNSRSPEQHNLFFAMVTKAYHNQQTDFRSADELRKALLIEAGHTEPQRRMNGEIVNVAKSMAISEMKQDAFQVLFDKCADLICEHIIPGLSKDDLLMEVRK